MFLISTRLFRNFKWFSITSSTRINLRSGISPETKLFFNELLLERRYFKVLAGNVLKDNPPSPCGHSHTDPYEGGIKEAKNPTNKLIQDSDSSSDIVTPHWELTGIEVFPSNFDKVPPKCTGCGAILQSHSPTKPGYVPENRNPILSSENEENSFMAEIICSRCFDLKHYNKDTLPIVSPDVVHRYLKHISRQKALILYVVDMMDIPGSFVPDVLQLVGETKNILLVCNKVDRLAVDGIPVKQMERTRTSILNEARKFGLQNANILDTCVVSARTGFGIMELVKSITEYWKENSDIYIVGSTNCGKTTLFNIFTDLFSASRQNENMLQRGTVSSSPFTTLSLLRYPVTFHRMLRLHDRLRHGYMEGKDKLKEVDVDEDVMQEELTKYYNAGKVSSEKTKEPVDSSDVSIWQPEFVDVKNDDVQWIFDTPGVFSKNQISHFLSNQELKLLNPSLWFVPRTVLLTPGKVLFVGGLARLDYLHVHRMSRSADGEKEQVPKASQSVFFTVFASPNLPLHVTTLERANSFYQEHAGTDLLKVPSGDEERMAQFPALSGRVMEVHGEDWKHSATDVILSDVGWIGVTAGIGSVVSVKAYTPSGAGLFLRTPSLLPTCVRQRGRRGVPYLGHVNHSLYQGTRKRSPSLVRVLTKGEPCKTAQWMRVAEKKRQKQRALIKFEKMRWHSVKKIGFSAKSNPGRFLEDHVVDFEEIDGNVSAGAEDNVELEGNERHQGKQQDIRE